MTLYLVSISGRTHRWARREEKPVLVTRDPLLAIRTAQRMERQLYAAGLIVDGGRIDRITDDDILEHAIAGWRNRRSWLLRLLYG